MERRLGPVGERAGACAGTCAGARTAASRERDAGRWPWCVGWSVAPRAGRAGQRPVTTSDPVHRARRLVTAQAALDSRAWPSSGRSGSSSAARWPRCSSSRRAATRSSSASRSSTPPRRPSSARAPPSATTRQAAREHFRRALAAARPQERMQLRRMADASLALAERRPDDLKEAVERLGQAPPSGRQLLLLRVMGLLAPPGGRLGRGPAARHRARRRPRGRAAALGFGIVKLVALPFGGVVAPPPALILGLAGDPRRPRRAGAPRAPPPGQGAGGARSGGG